MLTNSHTSFRMAVGRFVRFLYVLSLVLTVAGFLIIIQGTNFSATARTWLVAVFTLPAFFMLFAVYLHEGQFAEPLLRRRFYVGAITSMLFLLIPSIFLVSRYFLPSSFTHIARYFAYGFLLTMSVVTVATIFGSEKPKNGMFYLVSFVHVIMWKDWGSETLNKGDLSFGDIDVTKVRKQRADCYVDKEALQVFQGSLTCQAIEADVVSRLAMKHGLAKELSVLDIGGGEGLFTSNVLQSLQSGGYQILDVVMYDPVDWESEYQNNMAGVVPESRVRVERTGLDGIDENRLFDLVLVSHSMYAAWDCGKVTGNSAQDKCDRLFGAVNTDGMIVVTMASIRSPSQGFKRRAIQHVFGVEIEDVTAESVSRGFKEKIRDEQYIDNLIDFTSLIKEHREGGNGLRLWLSYFLRCDVMRLRRSDCMCLIDMLREHVCPLETLPEVEIPKWLKCRSPLLGRRSDVLMHKTKAFVLKV